MSRYEESSRPSPQPSPGAPPPPPPHDPGGTGHDVRVNRRETTTGGQARRGQPLSEGKEKEGGGGGGSGQLHNKNQSETITSKNCGIICV